MSRRIEFIQIIYTFELYYERNIEIQRLYTVYDLL